MKEKKITFETKQLTRIGLMVAFISALSYLRVPIPFSGAAITGQTLAVNLIALILSPLEAFIAMFVYWLLGLCGVPVFGGAAGPAKMFGPGGGYFLAFMIAVVIISKFKGEEYNFVRYAIVTILTGLLVIDGIGMVWMKFVASMSWEKAFTLGFLAFVPLDIVKCLLACTLAKPLSAALKALDD